MKKSSMPWSVKQFKKMFEKGSISFDYPIQRPSGQWDLLQKSLLIHTLSYDFPVPALYTIVEEKVYKVLDGKQRLTNTIDYLNDGFKLHPETPDTVIDDETHEIAGKLFSELHEDVQDQILSFNLLVYKMDDITDDEIEELFFRLNNGKALTKMQKGKALMGTAWAEMIKNLVNHPLMKNTHFTVSQIKNGDNEVAIFQTLMLMDQSYEWKDISSNSIFEYIKTFKADEENKLDLVGRLNDVMDYLNDVIETKEKVLLKKTNFPMLLLTAEQAVKKDIHIHQFYDWMEEFKLALREKGDIQTTYKEFEGQGNVKREKTLGRLKEMERCFDEHFMMAN